MSKLPNRAPEPVGEPPNHSVSEPSRSPIPPPTTFYQVIAPREDEALDLRKYGRILKRGALPALVVFTLVTGGAVLAALRLPDLYRAEGKVLFRRDRTPALTGLNEDLGTVEKLTFQGNPLDTQVEIVGSSPVLQRVIAALDLRDEEGAPLKLQDLRDRLSIQPIAGTEILQITYGSPQPEQAAAVVNQLIEAYRQENIATNREEVVTAREFIEAQLPLSEAEVLQLEEALRQFKLNNRIVSLDREADNTIDLISGLSQEIIQLKAQYAGISARRAEAEQQIGMGVQASLSSARLNQSEGIQTALAELQAVQGELAQEQARYLDSHPVVRSLKQRETNLRNLVQQRVEQVAGQPLESVNLGALQGGDLRQGLIADYARLEMERVDLAQRIAELSQDQQLYVQRAAALPTLEKGQRDLERRLEAAQATYETLLNQLQEIRTAETQVVGNVKVISIAEVPNQAAGPRRSLIVAAGAVLGSLLGLSTALLMHLNPKENKQRTAQRTAHFPEPAPGPPHRILPALSLLSRHVPEKESASK